MRPGDHPEFFRFPAPEGRSRESTIVLDAEGSFHHDGEVVAHDKLARAMRRWIRRHPDDGRYVLSNGYDWTYFSVEDVPFFVESVGIEADRVMLRLDDGTEEPWDPALSRVGKGGALYATVKPDADGGPYEARFHRHAQTALAPVLEVDADGRVGAHIGGRFVPIRS
ncbi:MAG TPA: hypothetical protein VF316_18605 [Polyangiaceae bacterium]